MYNIVYTKNLTLIKQGNFQTIDDAKIVLNEIQDMGKFTIVPSQDHVIDAILDNVFIRGIDLNDYSHEFIYAYKPILKLFSGE